MRVKCIKKEKPDGWWVVYKVLGIPVKFGKGPRYNDELTVIDNYWRDGELYLQFKEWPGNFGFTAEGFVPIDEPKEQYEEVSFKKLKQNVPVGSKN